MGAKKAWSRISALVLSFCVVISCLPTAALAADSSYSEITKQNVELVQTYAVDMQQKNTKVDYSKGGFSWDTEKKTDSWRYFNGLMLDAFLMMGDTDYAKAFYDSNIKADGTIKNYHTGELDSVEAARGLFDLLRSDSLTVEERTKYQEAVQYVYSQLRQQTTYPGCGDNFLHKQDPSGEPTSSWSKYSIGLDGLYMALPFLVEYANALKEGLLDPVQEVEVPADLTLTKPEQPAAGDVTDPEQPAAGDETNPEDPGTGDVTTPEDPNAGNVTTPEDPGTGDVTTPEDPGTGDETTPEAPGTSDTTTPETSGNTNNEAGNEQSGETIEAQSVQYASTDSETAETIYADVYKRLTWVSENMYDETTELFHHGWNVSKNQGNGHFWARGLGWYAMALVDIAEMMPSSYQKELTAQMQKLFGGLMRYQNVDTGMWYNVVTRDSSLSGNNLETSGSSMFAYAMMKAYCCGYVDDTVGGAGLAAFNGTVSKKLSNGSVADIYLKSGVGDSDSYYCTYGYESDEAKGTGALIMAATWAEKAAAKLEKSLAQNTPVVPDPFTGVEVESATITAITVTNVTSAGYVTSALSGLLQPGYAAYDIDPEGYVKDDTVTVRLPIPSGVDAAVAVAYYVPADGSAPEQIKGTLAQNEKFLEFTTNHFSTYAVGAARNVTLPPDGAVTGNVLESGGGTTYELATNGVEDGATYLIVNTDKEYALQNNGGSAAAQPVTVSGNTATISGNESDCLWTFTQSESGWQIKNGSYYLVLKSDIFKTSPEELTVTSKGNGLYTVKRDKYYLNYDGSWKREKSEYSVLLYKQIPSTETEGDKIWFNVTPKKVELTEGDTYVLEAQVGYVDGKELTNGFTVTYTSSNDGVATVDSSGKIIAVSTGTVTITAKLTSVDGKNVEIDSIPISVTVKQKPAFDPDHPYDGLKPANPNNRPVYPDAGAVRLDKTASADHFTDTGVTRVELSVAGISEKRGVDVVLVVDVSNSMAWSLENSGEANDAAKLPTKGQSTKLDNAMAAAAAFSDILLKENTGADSDNSLSFVTFAGYDAEKYNTSSKEYNDKEDFVDSVMTVFTNVKSAADAQISFSRTSLTGTPKDTDKTKADYTLKVTDEAGKELVGKNRGNTNYDYAFYQARQAVVDLQAQYPTNYAESGRETYIVFMTDGAPSHYNDDNCVGGSGRDYLPGSEKTYDLGQTMDNWTDFIKGTNKYATDLYKLVNGNFYAIGFDLANGGFSSGSSSYTADEATLTEVLANMAGGGDKTIPVMTTSNAETLTAFYKKLANQIKYAGTYAKVTDTVHSDFTLQTEPYTVDGSSFTPTITVCTYDLYTAETAGGNASLIGTRIPGTRDPLIEVEITGNDTISNDIFTYTNSNGVETFVWNIGDIADKEYVLSYDACIKKKTDGLHDTNEKATLEYIDVNNCYDNREFPIPSLSWGSAVTQVEYYLANEDGDAVNWNGSLIPFPNRIRIGGTAAVNVPWDTQVKVSGAAFLAYAGVNGYTMVDPDAEYTVITNADGTGSLEITGTGVQRVDQDSNLKSSTVAFGVKRGDKLPPMYYSLTEKQAVIDFDKPMLINVTTDNNAPKDYTAIPVAFAPYSDSVDLSYQQQNTGAVNVSGTFGTFSLEGDQVKYTPNAMLDTVDRVFVVNKIAQGDIYYYMYQTLTVIPATVVYYETEFAPLKPGGSWSHQVEHQVETLGTDYQDTGLVSVNDQQTYGYDSSYVNDTSVYSNGSAYQVELAQGAIATTSFSFSGTGFDIISRTGPDQGMIQVEVEGPETKKVVVLNKGDQKLNQIPVVSVNGLTPGSYTVTITAYGAYTNTKYQQLNRGGQFVFDAVRIYEPMKAASPVDQKVAEVAYVAHGEKDPQFNEVRAQLFANNSYGGGYTVSYVDSKAGAAFEEYKKIGPNNEVYLASGQSIAFTVNRDSLSSFDIGAKTVNGTAAIMKVSIGESSTTFNVKSGTALYYRQEASAVKNGSTVVITNTEGGILSITDIKTTVASMSASAVHLSAGPTTVARAKAILIQNKLASALGKEETAK